MSTTINDERNTPLSGTLLNNRHSEKSDLYTSITNEDENTKQHPLRHLMLFIFIIIFLSSSLTFMYIQPIATATAKVIF